MFEVKTLEWIEQEFVDGYRDGCDPDSIEPSGNRSEAYRHSFEIGRAELHKRYIPAAVSRQRAEEIVARYHSGVQTSD